MDEHLDRPEDIDFESDAPKESPPPSSLELSRTGLKSIQGAEPADQSDVAPLLHGTPDEVASLQQSYAQLQTTEVGKEITDAIRKNGTTVQFGVTGDGVVAQFDSFSNHITVDEGMKEATPAVLAAHLAHEGTHVLWNEPDSIDQEYHAFEAEAKVWNQLKGDKTDSQCGAVSTMIASGETEAKAQIRQMYPALPEYWRK